MSYLTNPTNATFRLPPPDQLEDGGTVVSPDTTKGPKRVGFWGALRLLRCEVVWTMIRVLPKMRRDQMFRTAFYIVMTLGISWGKTTINKVECSSPLVSSVVSNLPHSFRV